MVLDWSFFVLMLDLVFVMALVLILGQNRQARSKQDSNRVWLKSKLVPDTAQKNWKRIDKVKTQYSQSPDWVKRAEQSSDRVN